MVVPLAIAAGKAASTAGSAGAAALGISMGKTDLDLTRELFKLQMRQAKRLWTADWAEASVRHGEQCLQSAQQHAESQAMAKASYFQAEKLNSQAIKLARDQDSRSYEIAWRAEVRESLRDELANQYNRYNIVMLCDTVCLSCVFSLVAESSLPQGTTSWMLNLYVGSMGVSITLFSISLWCSLIAVRRLHEHTAAILERKLFAQTEDLQKRWQQQLAQNLPTGPHELYLFHQAYEKWVSQYLDPVGVPSIHMMAIGVVMMFVTAGLLTHNRYIIEYNNALAVYIFWSTVCITSATILFMKFGEDRKEKKKQGLYDNSWQDQSTDENGPYAKITRTAKELYNSKALGLSSTERMELLGYHEQEERELCTKSKTLHCRVESLRKESQQWARTRKDVLQLLTTAAEELDALPEDLSASLNKLLYEIDKVDGKTASLVAMHTKPDKKILDVQGSSRKEWGRLPFNMSTASLSRKLMSPFPLDAQKIPVSLAAVRKKLGESTLSTLLRIKNYSDEPLRLKSGLQLKDGRYIKSLNATHPSKNTNVCYQLYPGTEIPPRSELVVAAKNNGVWVATSGIQGEIVYTNLNETWLFRIQFSNSLMLGTRKCRVTATQVAKADGDSNENVDSDNDGSAKEDQFWNITKEELDIKANNEISISIDVLDGDQGRQAALVYRDSQRNIKSGFLLKNKAFGLGLQWQQRWVVLTPTDILLSAHAHSEKQIKIAIKDIVDLRRGVDMVKKNVFEIHTRLQERGPYRFSASTPEEREDWIEHIIAVIGADAKSLSVEESTDDTIQSVMEDGIECVENDTGGTSVLPV